MFQFALDISPAITDDFTFHDLGGIEHDLDDDRIVTNEPPPVDPCYYQGSGYGLCEGIVLPHPGAVVLLTHPDKDGIFHLKGPAPLQTKQSVACGDAGRVYNHLDWATSYGSGVPDAVDGTCQSNTTVCNVRVGNAYAWTPVFVRQNNEPALLYLLWNSDKPGATISGYVRDKDNEGVADATVTAHRHRIVHERRRPDERFLSDRGHPRPVQPGSLRGRERGKCTQVLPREPQSSTLSVGDEAEADFTLNGGLKVP